MFDFDGVRWVHDCEMCLGGFLGKIGVTTQDTNGDILKFFRGDIKHHASCEPSISISQ